MERGFMSARCQGQGGPGGEIGPYAFAKGTFSPEIGLRPGQHQILQQAPCKALQQEHVGEDTALQYGQGQVPRLYRGWRTAAASIEVKR